MATNFEIQQAMLEAVARALGDELLQEIAFVGGCTTALMITDEFARDAVRATDDVDVLVHVLDISDWYKRLDGLKQRGFRQVPEDHVICRLRLAVDKQDIVVDFMPDDGSILGFTNRWYADALRNATYYELQSKFAIRVITPAYFFATKLEAYKGRGNNDPLASRDVEDLLSVIDGREELAAEIADSAEDLRNYISTEVDQLVKNRDFGYAVQSIVNNQRGREKIIFQRLEALTMRRK